MATATTAANPLDDLFTQTHGQNAGPAATPATSTSPLDDLFNETHGQQSAISSPIQSTEGSALVSEVPQSPEAALEATPEPAPPQSNPLLREIGRSFRDFGKGFIYDSIIAPARALHQAGVEEMKNAPMVPGSYAWGVVKALGNGVLQGMSSEEDAAAEAIHRGEYMKAFGHHLAGSIPFIGPLAGEIGETLTNPDTGNFARGTGQVAGLFLPELAGGVLRSVKEIVPPAAHVPGGVLEEMKTGLHQIPFKKYRKAQYDTEMAQYQSAIDALDKQYAADVAAAEQKARKQYGANLVDKADKIDAAQKEFADLHRQLVTDARTEAMKFGDPAMTPEDIGNGVGQSILQKKGVAQKLYDKVEKHANGITEPTVQETAEVLRKPTLVGGLGNGLKVANSLEELAAPTPGSNVRTTAQIFKDIRNLEPELKRVENEFFDRQESVRKQMSGTVVLKRGQQLPLDPGVRAGMSAADYDAKVAKLMGDTEKVYNDAHARMSALRKEFDEAAHSEAAAELSARKTKEAASASESVPEVPTPQSAQSTVQVSTSGLKSIAQRYSNMLEERGALLDPKGLADVQAHLAAIIDGPDTISYSAASGAASDLLDTVRQIDQPMPKLRGKINAELAGELKRATSEALEKSSPDIAKALNTANQMWTDLHKPIVLEALDRMQSGRPETVHQLLTAPGTSVQDLRDLKAVVSPAAWRSMAARSLSDMIEDSIKTKTLSNPITGKLTLGKSPVMVEQLGDSIAKAIEDLDRSGKLQELYPETAAKLRQMVQIAKENRNVKINSTVKKVKADIPPVPDKDTVIAKPELYKPEATLKSGLTDIALAGAGAYSLFGLYMHHSLSAAATTATISTAAYGLAKIITNPAGANKFIRYMRAVGSGNNALAASIGMQLAFMATRDQRMHDSSYGKNATVSATIGPSQSGPGDRDQISNEEWMRQHPELYPPQMSPQMGTGAGSDTSVVSPVPPPPRPPQ